jgi:ribonuclease Z
MALSLSVLGCSSATPTTHRHPSAYILKSNKRKDFFLIDCGEGTQFLMRNMGIKMNRISRIFISHLHGDHYFGLIGFVTSQNLFGRKEELHIYAHKPLEKIIKLQLKIDNITLSYPLTFHALNTRKKKNYVLYEDKSIKISTFPLLHSIHTNGFFFKEKILSKDSKTFAYCSDTAYTETIIPYIKDVNMLYHEATFMEDKAQIAKDKYHSTAKQAAEIAKLAGVKQLLIGHYSARYKDIIPLLEEAKTFFPNTQAAVEGTILKI